MTTRRPTIPVVAPASWLRPHAAYLTQRLRERGEDEESALNILSIALIEETALFTAAYTRWVADPRKLCGEADIHLALAGVTLAAYAVSHQLGSGSELDDWCGLKLRHIERDSTHGWGKQA